MSIGPTKIELMICDKCDCCIQEYKNGYFIYSCDHPSFNGKPMYIRDAMCGVTNTREWCPCLPREEGDR